MDEHDGNVIFEPMREQLSAWKKDIPDNFYTADANLCSSLLYWLGEKRLDEYKNVFERAGSDAATILNDWAIETNRDENLPRLRRFDGNGVRTEGIDFHPNYHEMGRKIYGTGIMSLHAKPGNDLIQLVLFYLFMHNGEAGHCCPLACTSGAIKLLTRVGNDELKDRYLPRLLDPNYDTHLHASQFLTEIQGGSDVGANATIAVEKDGQWRLYGEKWFCSVIDAGLMVLTARPKGAQRGTRGLTTFIAPRYLEDGRPNNFEVKRIKYKIGTRSMATAEIDLNGLIAYPLGNPGEGFKYAVDIVLNTSRLYNGFAAAGISARAYLEALTFAKSREAFGEKIIAFPLVKRSIAFLRAEAALQLSSSLHVASLAEKIACGNEERDLKEFRFLVNANKYWTSIRCTQAVREAIEVLGGNGTIEEFSVLPRLYRDAIVFESWEGAHNVLCQQLLRDMLRYQVHKPVFERAAKRLEELPAGKLSTQRKALGARLENCKQCCEQLLKMTPEKMQLHIRSWVNKTMAAIQGVDLLCEANAENIRAKESGKLAIVDYHLLRTIGNAGPFGNDNLADIEKSLIGE